MALTLPVFRDRRRKDLIRDAAVHITDVVIHITEATHVRLGVAVYESHAAAAAGVAPLEDVPLALGDGLPTPEQFLQDPAAAAAVATLKARLYAILPQHPRFRQAVSEAANPTSSSASASVSAEGVTASSPTAAPATTPAAPPRSIPEAIERARGRLDPTAIAPPAAPAPPETPVQPQSQPQPQPQPQAAPRRVTPLVDPRLSIRRRP